MPGGWESFQYWWMEMPKTRQTFATRVSAEILSAVRQLAEKEGRPIGSLLEEALADLIEKRTGAGPRAHVMGAYAGSHEEYGALYKKLAE